MRLLLFAAASAALLWSSSASAQNYALSSVTESARMVYASCENMSRRAGLADARAACACITGYMGASMTDRDFEIAGFLLRVGEMAETGAGDAAIGAEVMAFFERGFTEQDVERVAATVEQISGRGDAICGQFERSPSV